MSHEKCHLCHSDLSEQSNFCPNCGAYLKGSWNREAERGVAKKKEKPKAEPMPGGAKLLLGIGIAMMLTIFGFAIYDNLDSLDHGNHSCTLDITVTVSDGPVYCEIYIGEGEDRETVFRGIVNGSWSDSALYEWYGASTSSVTVEIVPEGRPPLVQRVTVTADGHVAVPAFSVA